MKKKSKYYKPNFAITKFSEHDVVITSDAYGTGVLYSWDDSWSSNWKNS